MTSQPHVAGAVYFLKDYSYKFQGGLFSTKGGLIVMLEKMF